MICKPRVIRAAFLTVIFLAALACRPAAEAPSEQAAARQFEPSWQSLQAHQVPEWFHDAKLGIFIHWGIYSVPAWAPPTGELGKVDWNVWFKNNPYAEWYMNTLKFEDSPTRQHHVQTYGKDFDYLDFIPEFNKQIAKWDPNAWAKLFQEVGARYVVLTSKHHDGFTLWPSQVKNPNRPDDRQHADRDLVGELTTAVRGEGLRMGLYYSGGLDWSFNPQPVKVREDVLGTVINTPEYAQYADAQWRELIERYQPAILWNDISYPRQGDTLHIFSDYYNSQPDGLINNRFRTPHHDFTTPEYAKMDKITEEKWETCRGLGFSFGYNQIEGPEHVLESGDLIRLLIDIVSKNGNLLLNIGPRPDGSISEIQEDRLRDLGGWLAINGEAIYGTRPWVRSDGVTAAGDELRFTQKGDSLYAILMSEPALRVVSIKDLKLDTSTKITAIGSDQPLGWSANDKGVVVYLPERLRGEFAYTLKITPKPAE